MVLFDTCFGKDLYLLDFFNDHNQSWLRDGIFYFELDQKIPKSRGSGSGFENPEKIPSEKFLFPGFFVISGFGIFRNFVIFISGIFTKSPGFMQNPNDSGFFRDFLLLGYPGDFLSQGSGFFRGMGYPDKKPTLIIMTEFLSLQRCCKIHVNLYIIDKSIYYR